MIDLTGLTANLHFTRTCNYRCRFCFAAYPELPHGLPLSLASWKGIIADLAEAGLRRVNFVGGEPTLYLEALGSMIEEARVQGLEVSIVTNGKRLPELLAEPVWLPDMVGLSVDSAREDVSCALGRGRAADRHPARSLELAEMLHEAGVMVKLNTVVTTLNWEEDMSEYIRAFRPHRWKVFQMLTVDGQNDCRVAELEVSTMQFRTFLKRHSPLAEEGFSPVAEDNDAMTESYLMLDPIGRFFDNEGGVQHYSQPVPEVGLEAALGEVRFDAGKFGKRGGHVELLGRPAGV